MTTPEPTVLIGVDAGGVVILIAAERPELLLDPERSLALELGEIILGGGSVVRRPAREAQDGTVQWNEPLPPGEPR